MMLIIITIVLFLSETRKGTIQICIYALGIREAAKKFFASFRSNILWGFFSHQNPFSAILRHKEEKKKNPMITMLEGGWREGLCNLFCGFPENSSVFYRKVCILPLVIS